MWRGHGTAVGVQGKGWGISPVLPLHATLPSGDGRLIIAAQELHAQRDAVVPGHRQDAHKAGVEGRVEHVLLVQAVVTVPVEDLWRRREPLKWGAGTAGKELPYTCLGELPKGLIEQQPAPPTQPGREVSARVPCAHSSQEQVLCPLPLPATSSSITSSSLASKTLSQEQ